MLKKVLCALGILVLLFGAAPQVQATDNSGEIRVNLRDGELVVTDGSMEVYLAGQPVPEGYLLGQEFGGGIIAGEDVPSPDFAQWMAARAGTGMIRTADEQGVVRFTGLEPGLYLVRQCEPSQGYFSISPYLACITEEINIVDTYPKLKSTGSLPRTSEASDLYIGALGLAFGLTGVIFWEEARRMEQKTRKR